MNVLGLRIKKLDCNAKKCREDPRKPIINRPRGSSSNYPPGRPGDDGPIVGIAG
jgi:hypothetical protein